MGEKLMVAKNVSGISLAISCWVNSVLGIYEGLNVDSVQLAHSSVGVLGTK